MHIFNTVSVTIAAQCVNVSTLLQKTCLKIILCLSERSNMLSTDGYISLFIIHMQTEDVRGNVSSDGKWKMCTGGKRRGRQMLSPVRELLRLYGPFHTLSVFCKLATIVIL